MRIKEKNMKNESKLKSLCEENINLIKSPIKLSNKNIIKSLKEAEENGSTALGAAILVSLSL
jgi:NACalpha-BTF3-like transcription factor